MSNIVVIYLLVGIAIGYAVGRIDALIGMLRGSSTSVKPRSFFDPEPPAKTDKTKFEIDERKYVSQVSTDTLTKTDSTALGKISVAEDNIGQSVSKLAQLKGK